MKTLIISYLPRGERSNTKKLLDVFLKNTSGEVEQLDLTKDVPDLLLETNLAAYYKRNYGGETLDEKEIQALEKMDRMTEQLLSAEAIVLAYPMFNFSLPATVKAYFDSVLQKNKTWDINSDGFVGLLKGKKALIITSSAGKYTLEAGNISLDHSVSLSKTLFQFMGIEPELINAQGLNPTDTSSVILAAQAEVEAVAKKWY